MKEEKVTLYGREYNQITYEDGSATLTRYDEKYKMWITLKFKPDDFDDKPYIDALNQTIQKSLIAHITQRIE